MFYCLKRRTQASAKKKRNVKHSFEMRRPVFFFKEVKGEKRGEACSVRAKADREIVESREGQRTLVLDDSSCRKQLAKERIDSF